MLDHFLVGGAVVLQHVLDEIDAPARTVEFVANQNVSRTGRVAETAMDARAKNLVRRGDAGVGELGERKAGLHLKNPFACAPG